MERTVEFGLQYLHQINIPKPGYTYLDLFRIVVDRRRVETKVDEPSQPASFAVCYRGVRWWWWHLWVVSPYRASAFHRAIGISRAFGSSSLDCRSSSHKEDEGAQTACVSLCMYILESSILTTQPTSLPPSTTDASVVSIRYGSLPRAPSGEVFHSRGQPPSYPGPMIDPVFRAISVSVSRHRFGWPMGIP